MTLPLVNESRLLERIVAIEREVAELKARFTSPVAPTATPTDESHSLAMLAKQMGMRIRIVGLAGECVCEHDAAQLLGYSPKTLANWYFAHRPIKSVKAGGKRHYSFDALAAYIAGRDYNET